MAVSHLKEICEARNIKRIALVDDIFDAPSPQGLSVDRYRLFQDRFSKDDGLRRAVTWVSGRALDSLPAQADDLEEDEIDALWRSTWRPRVGGRRIKQTYRTELHNLFREHTHNLLAMLDEVVALFSLFRHSLARSVSVHGTDFDSEELAKAEIIVLDFFLGQNLTTQDAFDTASEVVQRTIDVANVRSRAAPSFLLVSSRPADIDINEFRASTQLMRSRFRFFSKESLSTTSTENMANLYDLIAASDRTSTVESLLDDWCRGAASAVQHVRDTVLSLDVSDLTYLDCFRLSHEGTTVPNYLKWFLTSLLSATVPSRLTPQTWTRAQRMRFADVFDADGNLDPQSLMATFDGPSDVIAHAYGDIIFDSNRDATNHATPKSEWSRDLMEGDLFVRPRGRRRDTLDQARVLLVLTPGCDLRVRGGQQAPSADAITLLPGILRPMLSEEKDRNFADGCFVRVHEKGTSRLLRVDWDYHRASSMDWKEFATTGLGRSFKRLGRIRDLYFHKIRDAFLSNLARIGTEVPPVLPHPLPGEVHIRVQASGKRRQEQIMSFSHTDGYVWEIGPVNLAGKGPSYFYQVSRHFLKQLSTALLERQNHDPLLAQDIQDASDRLDDLRTFMALVRPFRHGRRGTSDSVEIKKPVPRFKADTTSQAPILIVTFRD